MSKMSNARLLLLLVLLVLAMSLLGCALASPLPVPPQAVVLPQPDPALMKPPSTVDYSKRVQLNIQQWEKTLDSLPVK